MHQINSLWISDLTVEHRKAPLGIDVKTPRFCWKLQTSTPDTIQTAYRIKILEGDKCIADTGEIVTEQSIENSIPGFVPSPCTSYRVLLCVRDNHDRYAQAETTFETGLLGTGFYSSWVEPVQEATPSTMDLERDANDGIIPNSIQEEGRDFHEFRPAQYLRIPCTLREGIKKARIYCTAHGIYRLSVNGIRPDDREFAPEHTSYHKILNYQTYDVTSLLAEGRNIVGTILGDGWWSGRIGTTGDSCQYGSTLGFLMDLVVEYMDGTKEYFSAEDGVSSTGPIIFSDLFVGEKYDAGKEMPGWDTTSFDDSGWLPVRKKEVCDTEPDTFIYRKDHIIGQYADPVRPLRIITPARIFQTPNGDTMLDVGQVVAGNVEFTVTAPAGHCITLEHTEVMGDDGNYYNNILNVNKEQTVFYITKEGRQTYRPHFSYHGFRYVRIKGWLGNPFVSDFRIFIFTSEMDELSSFRTSDERLNRLDENIWWSQVANTISIPTDCPQREKAGWTGDIMVYAPTMCFRRGADSFLTAWMNNVRADQLEDGAIPMVVPYLKAYATFLKESLGTDTSCGWGDAVLMVPYAVYEAYGDVRILQENYDAMKRWLDYIDERAKNHHPKGFESWDSTHQARSRYLWNTDFHFGDWLIPSIVLGNPDGAAMNETAYATMGIIAPAYYAFSAKAMAKVAKAIGKTGDAVFYQNLYQKIRQAFIGEYVRSDGTFEAEFQGIYVISLYLDLVPAHLKEAMTEHLCQMIEENGNRLDTGFLSVPFLMDVLCEQGHSDLAYKLLYQTECPSWLYEVLSGGTTMWESWGAIGKNGEVSTYSYNHYAFGCIADWIYRKIGGLIIREPGYHRFHVAPDITCGLSNVSLTKETPYGTIVIQWEIIQDQVHLHVEIPPNTQASIQLCEINEAAVGSGCYDFVSRI